MAYLFQYDADFQHLQGANFIALDGGQWSVDALVAVLPAEMMTSILAIPIGACSGADRLCWCTTWVPHIPWRDLAMV